MTTDDDEVRVFDAAAAAELERQRDTSEMLLSVARALCEPTDLPAVSRIIADAVPTVCQADRGAVILWDETTNMFVVSAIAGWTGDTRRRLELWAGTPFPAPELRELMEIGAPVLLDESTNSWTHEIVVGFDIRALALVPITVAGRSMGFVAAHWAESDPPARLDDTVSSRFTGLAGLAGVALDNNRLAGEIEWNVQHDRVTRLPNRVAFERSLARMIEQADATGAGTVVMVCDIDRFKRLNDRMGQAAGDAVLIEAADRLRAAVRAGDVVARYGGDEFAIAFAKSNSYDEIAPAVARIQRSFSQPFAIDDHDVVLSLSIGWAALGRLETEGSPAERAQRLTAVAETDLMDTKESRRSTRGSSGSHDELTLDTDLHGAVERGEIFAVYQPQVDIASGRIVAVEALARWRHPTLGLVRPDRFIALAEENGTITQIGEHILLSACRDALTWNQLGRSIEVSVNASVVQLEKPGFATSVAAALCTLDFPAHMLTIEVTESKVVTDQSIAQAELNAISSLGAAVSIDDFGTGYSSLTQISNLPVTELKVDRSFVAKIDDGGEKLVAAIIGLSRGLDVRVIAEGVETQEQFEALARLGCDRAQGYLIAKPITSQELLSLLGDPTAVPTG
ncbi:sensor domain-containing phosphodiesterase [Salinibacterium sp. SYSU T00001]|uniref:putative bifunctional diguanylate cyclase/phosphodiesterase n=1 Tax=Homoserinimonas sedimenticola TaxID=2986805 RepID=UPI0022367BEC|nr:sensor domain-containing phosphodiesterase [Salinibacterium sedimenticola]MCW4386184.1 sensor domain-containing phosphodiesterase [Salinibacterium sedimenticola]